MPQFACNIDRRGRIARAISGLVCLLLAAAGAFGLLGFQAVWARLAFAVLLGLLGAFQLFEARKGWCAVRAAGFKTPL